MLSYYDFFAHSIKAEGDCIKETPRSQAGAAGSRRAAAGVGQLCCAAAGRRLVALSPCPARCRLPGAGLLQPMAPVDAAGWKKLLGRHKREGFGA